MSLQTAEPTLPQRMRAQGQEVQSLYRHGLTWVPLDPLPGLACGADITMRWMPGLGLQSGLVWGNRHHHTLADAAKASDDISLHVNLGGVSIVASRRGETVLREGDAILFSYSERRIVTRPELVDHRIVRLPRALLAPLIRGLDDALLIRIPRGAGALNLISHSIGAMIEDPALERPDVRQLIATQLSDLIAVTIGTTREVKSIAASRGIRAARLRAIKSDIEAHLGRNGLTPRVVARRQGISESYIRKLFEAEDTSFSEFVLNRRIARAYRMLVDRQCTDRTIASIAFEVGFGDLSYFNRVFKRTSGCCPSDVRACARPS